MKQDQTLGAAPQFFIAALVFLGLLGGSLILAHGGFETSSKSGGPSVLVPLPQAYLMAALMYTMSLIAALVLLRQHKASPALMLLSALLYLVSAWGLVWLITIW
jgi:hypothetical protein